MSRDDRPTSLSANLPFLLGALLSLGVVPGCQGTDLSNGNPNGSSEEDVFVDVGRRYQTMRGWEAHAQSAHEHASFPLFRDEVFDRAVNELGLNRVRLEMWSGAEQNADYYTQWLNGTLDYASWRCNRFATVNDNADPESINWSGFHFSKIDKGIRDVIQPLQARLAARGEDLYVNLLYVANTGQICGGGDYHHDDDPEEFAEFVLAHFLHLRDEFGIVPESFELILEPDTKLWWTRGRDLGESLVATMARLNANGFNPRVIAPSTAYASRALDLLDDIARAPGALGLIDMISYHRYDGPSTSVVRGIRNRAENLGKETGMLEWWNGADQETLYRDLVEGGVSSWEPSSVAWWNNGPPYPDKGGAFYMIDVQNPANPKVVMGSRARYLSQYFRWVRQDAIRIGATSSMSGVDPVAFQNTDGKLVVVVNVNGGKTFGIGGLAAGTYEITYTTASELQADGGSVTISAGEELSVPVPAAGVVTIVAR